MNITEIRSQCRIAVAAIGAAGLGCTPAMFGQTDDFGTKLARGCSTVEECDRLVAEAEQRNKDCAPNTMGKLRCGDTWKDLRHAKELQKPVGEKAKEKVSRKQEAASRSERAEAAKAEAAAYQDRQKKALAIAEDEVNTGRCHDSKVAAFRRVLAQTPQILESDQALVSIEAHKLVVATKEGIPLDIDAGLGGEYHIMAFSFAPLKLTVKDTQGYAVKDESMLADAVQSIFMPIAAEGRGLTTNRKDRLDVSVAGFGCTLVLVVRRIPL